MSVDGLAARRQPGARRADQTIGTLRAALGAGIVAVVVLGGAPRAAAQSSNSVAAEALFQEARKLLSAGRYAEACEKLAASEHIDPAVGTLLNLARCYEKIGRTASAWATYRKAIAAAKQAGQAERERVARRGAESLEPTLSRLTIVVPAELSPARPQVVRDGEAMPAELWGAVVPVDPGEHTISVSAAGKKPWSASVVVEAGASKDLTVPSLQPVEVEPGPPESPPPPGSARALPAASPAAPGEVPPAHRTSSWNAQKSLALVVTGVAVAGIAVGAVETVGYMNKKNEADNACPGDPCMEPGYSQAVSLLGEARTAETIAIVGGSVGGAALLGAAILWFTSNGEAESRGATLLRPYASTRGLGLQCVGEF